MMRPNEVDLALHLLDDQLIDADDTRCGRVDDIELSGGVGEATRVSALLVGAAAWPDRLPRFLGAVLDAVVGDVMVRIDWEAVEDVTTTVKLSRKAVELGIGATDGRNVRWSGERPHGVLRLSSLLGAPVQTQGGRDLGRVREVRAERLTASPDEGKVDEPWVVTGLLVGRQGILQRIGLTREERLDRRADAEPPSNFIGWKRLTKLDAKALTVTD